MNSMNGKDEHRTLVPSSFARIIQRAMLGECGGRLKHWAIQTKNKAKPLFVCVAKRVLCALFKQIFAAIIT